MDFLETVQEDLVPGAQEPCLICGDSHFYSEGGFFYCSTCNTQSQTTRLYVEEDTFVPGAIQHTRAQILQTEKRRGRKVRRRSNNQLLSSWEIFNIVLKIMGDRLVEIGFPEIVKEKIFNFYIGFLLKRKVIFVSKSNPYAQSTITYSEPLTNMYTIHGMERRKHEVVKRRKLESLGLHPPVPKKADNNDEEIDENDPTKFATMKAKKFRIATNKRKAMEQEYLSTEKEGDADAKFEELLKKKLSQETEPPTSDAVLPKKHSFLLSAATNRLKRSGLFKVQSGVRYVKKVLAGRAVNQNKRRKKISKILTLTRFENFTYKTCLILVFAALRQLGFPILMSDILRLYFFGILNVSIHEIANFARKHEEYQGVMHIPPLFNPNTLYDSYKISDSIEEFVKFLEIRKFRYPKLKEIVPKYIDEFVLPREFECLINLLNHLIPFEKITNDTKTQPCCKWLVFPQHNYKPMPEIVVLAQMIVILKMFFGLDDVTEKYQSSFAKLVNQLMKKEFGKVEPWSELFVIEDWFVYLLRRRELVKKEVCSPLLFNPNQLLSTTQINNFFQKTCKDFDTRDNVYLYNQKMPAAGEAAESAIELLKKLTINDSSDTPPLKQYIPLPLPTQSIVDQYLERYPEVADPSFKPELLKADFVQKRIDYLWNPKKYACLLEKHGYTLKVIKGDAVNDFPSELREEFEKSKIIVVFKPYKSYDDKIGRLRSDCSSSIKLLLDLCEDIMCDHNAEFLGSKYGWRFPLQKLVNYLGNTYIEMIKAEQVPVLVRWDELDSDSSD